MRTLAAVTAVALAAVPVAARAQSEDPNREHVFVIGDVMTKVVLDPTTYAPAALAWEATRLDWRTSQVFFRNGSLERNERFTVSGRRDDVAISYAAGNRRIALDALANMRFSLMNNLPERVLERAATVRYPQHRALLHTLGWIERSAVASYWSYRLSAAHFRQWRENERRASALGFD